MKFADFKALPRHTPPPPLITRVVSALTRGVNLFIPARQEDLAAYNNETISLCMGTCPICQWDLLTEVDDHRNKVFYQCTGNMLHYFNRPRI